MEYFGGVETGGTKCICVVASGPDQIFAEAQFSTGAPEETVENIVAFFRSTQKDLNTTLSAVGVASFGPVDLHPDSATYGYITSTPKSGWNHFDLLGSIRKEIDVPLAFDTDTNGAALGEYLWGKGRGLEVFIYLTVGTGIGGGAVVNGKPIHGLMHTEMGHILLPHDWSADPFPGVCPYHGDCFEGLASGPAISKRWGRPAKVLPSNHPAWDLEAAYLAAGLHNHICSLAPQRIILGGGVMKKTGLIDRVRSKVQSSLAGYVPADEILNNIQRYIVLPALGDRAGVLGAVALAIQASRGLDRVSSS